MWQSLFINIFIFQVINIYTDPGGRFIILQGTFFHWTFEFVQCIFVFNIITISEGWPGSYEHILSTGGGCLPVCLWMVAWEETHWYTKCLTESLTQLESLLSSPIQDDVHWGYGEAWTHEGPGDWEPLVLRGAKTERQNAQPLKICQRWSKCWLSLLNRPPNLPPGCSYYMLEKDDGLLLGFLLGEAKLTVEGIRLGISAARMIS